MAEGAAPDKDVYEVMATVAMSDIRALRVEALTDPSLPNMGPGRADNSNFVLNEIEAEVSPAGSPEIVEKVRFIAADADYSQPTFEIAKAIDGKPETGWAVDGTRSTERDGDLRGGSRVWFW